MKNSRCKSIRSFLICCVALSALPLLQGCDDDSTDNTHAKNAWVPAEFQIIIVGTGNSSGSGGSGTGY